MKTTLLLCLSLYLTVQLQAQQYYHFSEDTDVYTPLANDTVAEAHDFVNDMLTLIPMGGETFNFFGKDFPFGGIKTLYIQTYGNLRIDDDSTTVIIDGIFTTLEAVDTTTQVSYVVEGSSGNKTVKVEWRNVRIANGPANNHCTFQIWLHQQSGTIELRYGPRSANNASAYNSSTGPYAGIFYSDDSFVTLYEKLWLHGNPNNIQQDTSGQFTFRRLFGIPEEGVVWRFTPKKLLSGITETPFTNISLTPNPAANQLTISGLSANQQSEYEIITVSGKQLESGSLLAGTTTNLSIGDLPPGIYLLRLTNNSQHSTIHRFVKQ
jgi:hypothetical protein